MNSNPVSVSAPLTFSFVSSSLRVLLREGNPWFVAADVCAALGIGNTTDALRRLDDDEQALDSIEGIHRGSDQVNVVNESGLYSLILGSRKPEAKKFKKWVTSEVLPAIRKTGRYEAPAPNPRAYERISPDQQQQLADAVRRAMAGWVFANEHRQHLYNTLRVVFHLEHIAELPAADFDQALRIIGQVKDMNWQFLLFVSEAREAYLKEYVLAGAPWTPWLGREWKKQMRDALPARPRWGEIQHQLGLMKPEGGPALTDEPAGRKEPWPKWLGKE